MNTEQAIAEFIVRLLREHGSLLGATLGSQVSSWVRQEFPDFNMGIYRNLTTFINNWCSGRVIVLSRQGLDIRWGLSDATDERTLQQTTTPDKAEVRTGFAVGITKKNSAWHAFIHPDASEKLLVNMESAEIQVASIEIQPQRPWVDVPKITPAEHRAIAVAFIPQLDSSDQGRFKNALGSDDFWLKWSSDMKNADFRKYAKTWVDFRFHRLCEFFRQRLTGLGASDSIVTASLNALKVLKSQERQERKKPAALARDDQGSVRKAVIRAIGEMSDEELRQLWLPVGVIHDALQRN